MREIVQGTNVSSNEHYFVAQTVDDYSVVFENEACFSFAYLFEAQVRRTPEAIALVNGDEHVSYEDLNRRANQLACYLRGIGVGPDILVGVCLPRSLDLIVCQLGILKAGGAYVPFDPLLPPSYLAFMIADTKTPLLLTSTVLRTQLMGVSTPLWCVDTDWVTLAPTDTDNLPASMQPQQLAYAIYTSGSTGTPKGVLISQRSLVHLVAWHVHAFSTTAQDRTTLLAGVGFDASGWEIWPSLLAGACITVVPDTLRLDPQGFQRWLEEQAITLSFVPTAFADLLLGLSWPETTGLRTLLTGGDVLHRYPTPTIPFAVINNYGPTENTVVTTSGHVPVEPSSRDLPSIGYPVSNTQLYVLDPSLQPVPQGVVGELYIGGSGLARGYLNQAGLTAERFLPHPFADEPGARLYRSGDLVRQRDDGSLSFVGRLDQQVKLRGFRVELGEIETRLLEHPVVEEGVVVVHEDAAGGKHLVAYLVIKAGQQVHDEDLRQFLQARVPSYMVPSFFERLERFPLTASGKLDRRALPALRRQERDENLLAPRSELEELLVEIWREVLDREQVGVMDNFFKLGGDSIQAVRVLSRVRNLFQVELSFEDLFAAPQIARQAEQVAAAQGVGQMVTGIERVSQETKVLPLSRSQESLWIVDRLTPDLIAYNVPLLLKIQGPLDVQALQESLHAILTRHDILSTTFQEVDGQLQQVIGIIDLPKIAMRDLSIEPQTNWIHAITMVCRQPFSLDRGPLFRAEIWRLSADDFMLLLNLHHIITDGWSTKVLLDELAAGYTARIEQTTSVLAPLPVQYADYALWQHAYLRGAVLERLLAYWRTQLHEVPFPLPLPLDHPRPRNFRYRGGQQRFLMSTSLHTALRRLGQREGCTLFMTLVAGVQMLLARLTQMDDIVIGTPSANRQQSELEGLIGYFVNMLVVRTDLSGNPSVRRVLARVREMTLQAYEHQDLPFEQLVRELKPPRDPQYSSPFFQVVVQLSLPLPPISLPSLQVQMLDVEMDTAKFDLDFEFAETPEGLQGIIRYNVDVFDASSIERMSQHLEQLLTGMITDPDQCLSDLPLLTAQERTRLLVEWNATHIPYQDTIAPAYLFEAQVQRTPEAIALVNGEEHVSYEDLNRRANQLAHYLRGIGVGPDVLVGVCLPRSLDLIVCQLGIFKAGGAYVPFDPLLPLSHLTFMIADTKTPLVLTSTVLRTQLMGVSTPLWCVDTDWVTLAPTDTDDLRVLMQPQQLAYAIYTSGSTGTPKGVLISQQSLVHLVAWHKHEFAMTAQDRTTLLAGVGFDASGWEVWPSLLAGACITVVPDTLRLDPQGFQRWLEEQAITLSFVPTAFADLLLGLSWPETTGLRTLLTGGDVLHRYPTSTIPFAVINNYGPTENTVVTTSGHVPVEPSSRDLPSIGYPVSNTQLYVLDPSLQPVPQGVVGELYIGGSGLARGYLNQAGLTAERFLPHPFADEPGARLYRSGDLVRQRDDGSLSFVGRLDQQVKLRGFRVELGEIETRLLEHPVVEEGVVVVHEDAAGGKHLVAYLVIKAGQQVHDEDLRQFLQARVPSYMMPTFFERLERFPLTASGKLDRRALPALQRQERDENLLAPRSELEELLLGIWREVLDREQVGVMDNFFELGGDSIQAARLLSRVRSLFQVELSFADLFASPQIARQAEQVAAAQGVGQMVTRIEQASQTTKVLPLSWSQESLWIVDRLTPDLIAYNVPLLLKIQGPLDIQALQESLHAILARHDILTTTFQEVDEVLMQVPGTVHHQALSVRDLRGTAEAVWRQDVAQACHALFDLSQGPLMHVDLWRIQDDMSVLLLNLHHIITDGWSTMVLLNELSVGYTARIAQSVSALTPLPVQYADYALWQHSYLQGAVLERLLTYWRTQLHEVPFPLPLPLDHPRPRNFRYRGGLMRFQLSTSLHTALRRLSQQEGCTLFMTLVAGVQMLLARLTQMDDIVIGTPSANRRQPELEGLIGYFVNMLIVRTDLSGNPSVRRVLARVREVTLQAYAHQDLPFEQLVRELKPPRDPRYSLPLFQVVVRLRAEFPPILLPQLQVQMLDVEMGIAKFDLDFEFVETSEGLQGMIEYNADIFDASSIGRMSQHLEHLLTTMVTDPDQYLADLSW